MTKQRAQDTDDQQGEIRHAPPLLLGVWPGYLHHSAQSLRPSSRG